MLSRWLSNPMIDGTPTTGARAPIVRRVPAETPS